MVSRSSKLQVMFGPTARRRWILCSMTCARNSLRLRAYCSRLKSCSTVSFSMARPSNPVGEPQQPQRVFRASRTWRQQALDLVARHGAIAGVVGGRGILHPACHGAANLHRGRAEFLLHGIGAVVTGTALDDVNRGVGHQPQHIAGLQADVLHPQVTGNMVADLAE